MAAAREIVLTLFQGVTALTALAAALFTAQSLGAPPATSYSSASGPNSATGSAAPPDHADRLAAGL
jgi:hypothetical protein